MKNKKQLIKGNKIIGEKEQSNEKYDYTSMKTKQECDVHFDTSNLIVAVADGVLTNIDEQDKEIRLLFFHNIPTINFGFDDKDKEKTHIKNKAIIEVRVTYSGFKNIISSMAGLISDFDMLEKKKAPLIEFLKKQGTDHEVMFR